MPTHSFTHYFLQSKDKNGLVQTVAHSKDKKTGELYHQFLDRKKAMALLEDENKVSPEYQYQCLPQLIAKAIFYR